MALSRVAARAVESGPDGGNLAAGAWQRLEALPDPRSPRGRVYPLACLIAIALCAFTAAGNDRFTAVGQWIKRAGQADLARLRAPWDPLAGRYRAPDEKTIRVVLDRLDPRALTRALLGPRPHGGQRSCGPGAASVRRYRARRAAQQARTRARARLRAVAVDGKTSRGARRADGTRVHLLGVAEHGGPLLDHLEVDVKHNETSHFTELLEPLDLAGVVVTFDALHTVRANLDWLVREKKAHYVAVVKQNQPLLYARVTALPWRQVPAGSVTRETGHGRLETRTVKAAHVSGLDFPWACQAIKITRWRKDTATGETAGHWLRLSHGGPRYARSFRERCRSRLHRSAGSQIHQLSVPPLSLADATTPGLLTVKCLRCVPKPEPKTGRCAAPLVGILSRLPGRGCGWVKESARD